MRVISSRDEAGEPVSPPDAPAQRPRRSLPPPALPDEIASGKPSQITDIAPQERHKDRVSVFVDGKFAIGIFADVAASLGLRIGQQITSERLGEIARAETLRKAKEDAVRLLGFRARSEKEVETRLTQKGYEDDIIALVVQSLRDLHYLDDEAFASAWVESRGKTRGRRALSHELRQKGIVGDLAQETLAEARTDDAEQEAAYLAAVKRVGVSPKDDSREARAKLSAFLQRRGFGWDTIKPVLTRVYAGTTDEESD